jgi:hypothetical protein
MYNFKDCVSGISEPYLSFSVQHNAARLCINILPFCEGLKFTPYRTKNPHLLTVSGSSMSCFQVLQLLSIPFKHNKWKTWVIIRFQRCIVTWKNQNYALGKSYLSIPWTVTPVQKKFMFKPSDSMHIGMQECTLSTHAHTHTYVHTYSTLSSKDMYYTPYHRSHCSVIYHSYCSCKIMQPGTNHCDISHEDSMSIPLVF